MDYKYIHCNIEPRYWEDAKVNGICESDDEPQIPCRSGSKWILWIDADEGRILHWPTGVTAKVHYKVCDQGSYYILDADKNTIASLEEGYVPSFLYPNASGYGDYVILDIDENGMIKHWKKPTEFDPEVWESC